MVTLSITPITWMTSLASKVGSTVSSGVAAIRSTLSATKTALEGMSFVKKAAVGITTLGSAALLGRKVYARIKASGERVPLDNVDNVDNVDEGQDNDNGLTLGK